MESWYREKEWTVRNANLGHISNPDFENAFRETRILIPENYKNSTYYYTPGKKTAFFGIISIKL